MPSCCRHFANYRFYLIITILFLASTCCFCDLLLTLKLEYVYPRFCNSTCEECKRCVQRPHSQMKLVIRNTAGTLYHLWRLPVPKTNDDNTYNTFNSEPSFVNPLTLYLNRPDQLEIVFSVGSESICEQKTQQMIHVDDTLNGDQQYILATQCYSLKIQSSSVCVRHFYGQYCLDFSMTTTTQQPDFDALAMGNKLAIYRSQSQRYRALFIATTSVLVLALVAVIFLASCGLYFYCQKSPSSSGFTKSINNSSGTTTLNVDNRSPKGSNYSTSRERMQMISEDETIRAYNSDVDGKLMTVIEQPPTTIAAPKNTLPPMYFPPQYYG